MLKDDKNTIQKSKGIWSKMADRDLEIRCNVEVIPKLFQEESDVTWRRVVWPL